jgi:hemolysin activation/secretion protein
MAADNAGAPSSGRERLMASGAWRSPLGWRDEFSLNLTLSEGTRGGTLGYSLPVTRWDTRLALLLARDENDVVGGPFEPLNLNGDSTTTSVSLRQPIVVNNRHLIEASLAWRSRDSKNRAEEIQLQRTELSDWTLGVDSASVFGPLSLSAGLQWSEVDASVTDALGVRADRAYSVRRATLRSGWEFRPLWALRGTLGLQHGSESRLPAADQFFLGGDGTVRGYSASAVGGDRGRFVNVELHHPIPRAWQPDWMQASGFAFYDYGRVKPFRPDSSPLPPYEQVRSAGWGVNAQLGRAVFARLAVAHAIDEPQGETLGSTVWHAQASWVVW